MSLKTQSQSAYRPVSALHTAYTASKQLLLCGLELGLVLGPHFAVAASPDLPYPQASRKASRNVCRLDSLPPPQPECQHYRVLEAERPGPKAQSRLRPVWSRPAALGWELECSRTSRRLLPVLSHNLDVTLLVKTPLKTHGYFPPMSCPTPVGSCPRQALYRAVLKRMAPRAPLTWSKSCSSTCCWCSVT